MFFGLMTALDTDDLCSLPPCKKFFAVLELRTVRIGFPKWRKNVSQAIVCRLTLWCCA